MMKTNGFCKKCDGGLIRQEVMWQVTGQVDGQRNAIVVATCESCGNQWVVEE